MACSRQFASLVCAVFAASDRQWRERIVATWRSALRACGTIGRGEAAGSIFLMDKLVKICRKFNSVIHYRYELYTLLALVFNLFLAINIPVNISIPILDNKCTFLKSIFNSGKNNIAIPALLDK